VIATGTPPGVQLGRPDPRWLRPGDVVRVEIDGLGALENPIVARSGARPQGGGA
jgi:acylpyruvate hydrolase